MNTSNGISNLIRFSVLLALLLLPVAGALAADITVDAGCSLANAIRAANEEELVEPLADCEAGDPLVDAENTGLDAITIDLSRDG